MRTTILSHITATPLMTPIKRNGKSPMPVLSSEQIQWLYKQLDFQRRQLAYPNCKKLTPFTAMTPLPVAHLNAVLFVSAALKTTMHT